MKVISGKYKGRVLKGFDIDGTRPTMDRVKESLFAMIQNYINQSCCLDLFSGSGNLGIEALSQGAKYCYFVDCNKKACETIKNNLENIGCLDYEIRKMDYQDALKFFFSLSIQFDLIFLDPPYQTNFIEKSLILIEKYQLISSNGIVVLESDNMEKIKYSAKWDIVKSRKYGDKWVVILKQV